MTLWIHTAADGTVTETDLPETLRPLPAVQFWLMLREFRITEAMVKAAAEQIPDEEERGRALILMEKARVFEPDHRFVLQLANAFGLTDAEGELSQVARAAWSDAFLKA